MNALTKAAAALWLTGVTLALVATPATAAYTLKTSVACGDYISNVGVTNASCVNRGEARFIDGSGTFNYRIQSTAATGYGLGLLRTYGRVEFDDLLRGRVGARLDNPAGTFAVVNYEDGFHFSLPNAAPNSTLTMRSLVRLHGGNIDNVDPNLFYDGNYAWMATDLTVSGLGGSRDPYLQSYVDIKDKTITNSGSEDGVRFFEQSVQLNGNSFDTYVRMGLTTRVQLVNWFPGSVGVGSGVLGADFSGTAGVVSIGFFDSQGLSVDYALTTDEGDFGFYQPTAQVPEASSVAMMLLGLCGVAVVAHRRRRSLVADPV